MKCFFNDSSLINQSELSKIFPVLQPYIKHLQHVVTSKNYEAAESSINLPTDTNIVTEVLNVKNKVNANLKYIVVIGIGGSNLGTKAVYDALFGHYDIIEPDRYPKMIFLDTTDGKIMKKFFSLLSTIEEKDEIIVNVISKSGGTTETIANFEVLYKSLEEKFGEYAKERVIVTTDEGSKLWKLAENLHFDLLSIPKQVGGRFSVLSSVGLFPLACAGIDVSSLLQGAAEMRSESLIDDPTQNPAFISAAITYLHLEQGKSINDSFFFLPELESLGKWYRQLTGESLGKEEDLNGIVVNTGLTPTVSIGSTDLHSVGQLYLGGPKDKMTSFIYSKDSSDISIPTLLQFPLVEGIEGKVLPEIMEAIYEGVKTAYTLQKLPFMEIILEKVNEYEIGAFLQFKMLEIMYLGKLLNINTFDQPHVELYKIETKKLLNPH